MAVYVGFHLGHDSNVAASIDGEVRYRKSERHFGIKHHKSGLEFLFETLRDWGIERVDSCAHTSLSNGCFPDFPRRPFIFGGARPKEQCGKDELFCKSSFHGLNCSSYEVDHHFSHTLSVWPLVPTDQIDYSVVIDGFGDWDRSAMVIERPATNPTILKAEYGASIGWEFFQVGSLLGLTGMEYDIAGKLMGLQAYSESQIREFGVPSFSAVNYKGVLNHDHNTLSEFHEYGWDCVRKWFQFPSNSVIAYSGGCAQNTVYNYRLRKEFPNIHIPPHCYDGGLSLGCLEFLRLQSGGDYLNADGFPYWQDDLINSVASRETILAVADLLASGRIVGWMQGRGEVGPRALGNRSILMGATEAINKDLLNDRVKHREPWRPYAGSVLENHALDFFDVQNSPFMLYACQVRSGLIPAITHIDKTCRIQTVKEGLFYDLIDAYYKRTGIPVLLNTSLNVAQKPIASNKQHGLELLRQSDLDALVVGNQIFSRKLFL